MPVVDGLPVPELGRQITPSHTAPGPPEHAVDHGAVIGPPATTTSSRVRQQRLQPSPFLIGQIMAIQHEPGLQHPPNKIYGTRSDMEGGLSSGQGEAVSTTVVVDTASMSGCRGVVASVSMIDALSV